MKPSVLIVEDDAAMAQVLVEGLARRGYDGRAVNTGEAALAAIHKNEFEAVVTDINMKGMDGLTLCERLIEGQPGLPVVVITGFGSMETAIKAMRAGAWDFITKPFELEALALALSRAVQHKQLREEVKRLREEASARKTTSTMVGEAPSFIEVLTLANRAAVTDSAVLITGERGTGKQLLARTLHEASKRRTGPFVTISCAGQSVAHLEQELFGVGKRLGAFSRAHGGTLVLLDVSEIPLDLQIRVVRALLERKVRPIGSDTDLPFDARIISTSDRDLQAEVDEHRFRDELFARLNIVNLHLPTLRMRGNDVLFVAQHFVKAFAQKAGKQVNGLATACAERLLAYPWPGNLSELESVIERAVALTRHEQLTTDDLPEKLRDFKPSAEATDHAALVPMEVIERQHILRVLKAVNGHRTQAAKILGLDRKTLYRKLETYDQAEVELALQGSTEH